MTVPFLLARSPVMVLLVEAILHENPKKDWVILHINSCGKQLLYAFLVEKNNPIVFLFCPSKEDVRNGTLQKFASTSEVSFSQKSLQGVRC